MNDTRNSPTSKAGMLTDEQIADLILSDLDVSDICSTGGTPEAKNARKYLDRRKDMVRDAQTLRRRYREQSTDMRLWWNEAAFSTLKPLKPQPDWGRLHPPIKLMAAYDCITGEGTFYPFRLRMRDEASARIDDKHGGLATSGRRLFHKRLMGRLTTVLKKTRGQGHEPAIVYVLRYDDHRLKVEGFIRCDDREVESVRECLRDLVGEWIGAPGLQCRTAIDRDLEFAGHLALATLETGASFRLSESLEAGAKAAYLTDWLA